MKYFLILLFLAGITGVASAVPYQDPQSIYDNSDTVLVGTILTVDIISEPVITRAENFFSETPGIAIYEIHVEEYLKNSGSDTITVAGFFTRESNAMSLHTYPYEEDQLVLLYLIKNNDTNTGLQFEIMSGLSRIIEGEICEEGQTFHRGECIVQASPLCDIIVDGVCVNPDGKTFDAGLNQMILFASIAGAAVTAFVIIWRKKK